MRNPDTDFILTTIAFLENNPITVCFMDNIQHYRIIPLEPSMFLSSSCSNSYSSCSSHSVIDDVSLPLKDMFNRRLNPLSVPRPFSSLRYKLCLFRTFSNNVPLRSCHLLLKKCTIMYNFDSDISKTLTCLYCYYLELASDFV